MEKSSFRQDAKLISKRLVDLFYLEKKIDTWRLSKEFGQIFNINAIKFMCIYWNRLYSNRQYTVLVLLLTLNKKYLTVLNKNDELRNFLSIVERDLVNKKLDKKFVRHIITIIKNRLPYSHRTEDTEKSSNVSSNESSNQKSNSNKNAIKYGINKIKYECKNPLCNSPIYKYKLHKKEDELNFKRNIKWKNNDIPTENERMQRYREMNICKLPGEINVTKKTIFKSTVVRETPLFLRSRHNFRNLSRTISIPKSSKSLLASNQYQPRRDIYLPEEEIKKINNQKTMALQQLHEEDEQRKHKKSKKGSKSSAKSANDKANNKNETPVSASASVSAPASASATITEEDEGLLSLRTDRETGLLNRTNRFERHRSLPEAITTTTTTTTTNHTINNTFNPTITTANVMEFGQFMNDMDLDPMNRMTMEEPTPLTAPLPTTTTPSTTTPSPPTLSSNPLYSSLALYQALFEENKCRLTEINFNDYTWNDEIVEFNKVFNTKFIMNEMENLSKKHFTLDDDQTPGETERKRTFNYLPSKTWNYPTPVQELVPLTKEEAHFAQRYRSRSIPS